MPELMTAPKQFAIQNVFEATLRNPATGELIAHLVNLKTSSLETICSPLFSDKHCKTL